MGPTTLSPFWGTKQPGKSALPKGTTATASRLEQGTLTDENPWSYPLSHNSFTHGWNPEGGGGTSICMNIRYVPRKRPPFSAPDIRSGAYHFHKWQKYSTISTPGLVAGQSASHTRHTVSSRDPHFHARAHSGALHFHARARSGASPIFRFAMAHTYQNLGGVQPHPPPPPSRDEIKPFRLRMTTSWRYCSFCQTWSSVLFLVLGVTILASLETKAIIDIKHYQNEIAECLYYWHAKKKKNYMRCYHSNIICCTRLWSRSRISQKFIPWVCFKYKWKSNLGERKVLESSSTNTSYSTSYQNSINVLCLTSMILASWGVCSAALPSHQAALGVW